MAAGPLEKYRDFGQKEIEYEISKAVLQGKSSEDHISSPLSRFAEISYFETGERGAVFSGTKKEIVNIYLKNGNHPAEIKFEGRMQSLSKYLQSQDESKIGGLGKSISQIPEFALACSQSLRLYCSGQKEQASKAISSWAYSSSHVLDIELAQATNADIQNLFAMREGEIISHKNAAPNLSKILSLFCEQDKIRFLPAEGDSELYSSERVWLFSGLRA